MEYKDRFLQALSKTKELGLNVEEVEFDEGISLEELRKALELAIDFLYQHGHTNSDTLASKCMPVHLIVHNVMRSVLGIKSYLTIGDRYWSDDDIYCEMSYESISKELESPDMNNPIKAHVWLTLTDGTILDFTSEAHLDVIGNRGNFPAERCYQVIPPDKGLAAGYHRPFLIGQDYLIKTGSIRINPTF
jgi:hypothetical protein